ncbi:Hypothetical predicted protein [Lecanosticta acicola]|uniref:Uncharacterized protein n=1 Tax=Lecanosticta acicola TaxID=111012 RepID=A0AAI8Z101_9PEZI|nr:Hypothetical predicted protein [Lecanosticta acicola]
MLRTHRPRGFAWNCPSVFQETQLFRDVRGDDCEHIPSREDLLELDGDDDFYIPQRAAKRRRIERIADEFMNGFLPEIHCATLDPQAVTEAIVYDCFERPRDAWDALERAVYERPRKENADMWEDVESGQDVLRAFLASQVPVNNALIRQDEGISCVQEPIITQIQAQASCRPRTRLRSTKPAIGPSEDALRVAAQLRNRRLQSSHIDLCESQPQSCPRHVIPETQTQYSYSEPQDETVSDCGPSPTPAWTSSKWITSGAFQLPRKDVNEDCSKDELGATSIFTSSQRSRNRSRPLARARSGTSAPTHPSFDTVPPPTASTYASTSFETTLSKAQERSEVQQFEVNTMDNQEACNVIGTSIEEQTEEDQSHADCDHGVDEADSQAKLLRQEGLDVRPRKSWATTNITRVDLAEPSVQSHANQDVCAANNPAVSGRRASLRSSALKNTQMAPRQRKAKSAGSTPAQTDKDKADRRRTAPLDSQQGADDIRKALVDNANKLAAFSTEYTQVDGQGGSPFMFRKRASRSNNFGESGVTPVSRPQQPLKKTRRPQAMSPSSESPQTLRAEEGHATEQVTREEDAGFGSETPLVNQYLNSILPKDTSTGRRSSSVKKALRDELKACGARMSRCADDSGSSQPEQMRARSDQPASDDRSDVERIQAARAAIESQGHAWPGTQALLYQAQKDLFTSPDKTDIDLYLGEKSTASADSGKKTGRQPLRQLSQEPLPMPSTQALLDGWKGWSSVKKPVSQERRTSYGQSPSVGKGLPKSFNSDSVQHAEFIDRRRSNLRFSMSFSDLPDVPHDESNGGEPSPRPATQPPQKTNLDSFLKPSLRTSSGRVASSLSFGFTPPDLPEKTAQTARHEQQERYDVPAATDTVFSTDKEPMTSYQYAQDPTVAVPQAGDVDSQVLYQDITELANDVLGSQAGTGLSF